MVGRSAPRSSGVPRARSADTPRALAVRSLERPREGLARGGSGSPDGHLPVSLLGVLAHGL